VSVHRSGDVRCEWGQAGIDRLGKSSDAVIIVDVLSFCTAVDVAVSRGAIVYPLRYRDDRAADFAESVSALVARPERTTTQGYSLAPTSLLGIPSGTRLVLPSPNGGALSAATGVVPTFAGCLRNASAMAEAATGAGRRISVIPAGERWADGSLRPALEDLIGAGAIISRLPGSRSPEAELAVAAFTRFRDDLRGCLRECVSGRELIERGFESDVALAAELDVSRSAPRLIEDAYRMVITTS
jgi:2-phosphosulfolactate phosphatase